MMPNDALIPGGFIVLARKMLDSDLMDQSPLVAKLWMWLLLKANWKDRDKLKRGQLVTTITEMKEAMSHRSGWCKISPTSDQIRSAYGTLRLTARITVQRTTRGMVVTVLNYERFQDISAYAPRTESRDGIATCPAATPHDTEEGKEEKKESLKPGGEKIDESDWIQAEIPMPSKPAPKNFVPPTVEEVMAYCKERGNGVNPDAYVNHYQSKGWMIGKNKMKDWKAAVRTWEQKNPAPITATYVSPAASTDYDPNRIDPRIRARLKQYAD